jgi:hypothetical protein
MQCNNYQCSLPKSNYQLPMRYNNRITYLWIETVTKLCDTRSDLVEGNRSTASPSLDYIHGSTAISWHDEMMIEVVEMWWWWWLLTVVATVVVQYSSIGMTNEVVIFSFFFFVDEMVDDGWQVVWTKLKMTNIHFWHLARRFNPLNLLVRCDLFVRAHKRTILLVVVLMMIPWYFPVGSKFKCACHIMPHTTCHMPHHAMHQSFPASFSTQ